jgi:hypothetical protein
VDDGFSDGAEAEKAQAEGRAHGAFGTQESW